MLRRRSEAAVDEMLRGRSEGLPGERRREPPAMALQVTDAVLPSAGVQPANDRNSQLKCGWS